MSLGAESGTHSNISPGWHWRRVQRVLSVSGRGGVPRLILDMVLSPKKCSFLILFVVNPRFFSSKSTSILYFIMFDSKYSVVNIVQYNSTINGAIFVYSVNRHRITYGVYSRCPQMRGQTK